MFELQGNRAELLEKIEDGLNRKCYAALRDLLLPMEAADIAGVCTAVSYTHLTLPTKRIV